jgi:hypothetical protein
LKNPGHGLIDKMRRLHTKRGLQKRIELINWVLENIKNRKVSICALIESRMNEIIDVINQTDLIFKADKLYSELRILGLDSLSSLY